MADSYTRLNYETLRELYNRSTQVNGWYDNYAYRGEVRGPFCRWLTVSKVAPEYEKYVGDLSDDARFAAAAMNNLSFLLDDLEVALKRIKQLEYQIKLLTMIKE